MMYEFFISAEVSVYLFAQMTYIYGLSNQNIKNCLGLQHKNFSIVEPNFYVPNISFPL